jgi:hypothetical protein
MVDPYSFLSLGMPQVRQKHCQQTDEGKQRAKSVDEFYPMDVGQPANHSCPDARRSVGQAKKCPETMPTLPGKSSWAKTRIAGKAEESIKPIMNVSTLVQRRLAKGSSIANGAAPRIEVQITRFLPMRSPTGPPKIVPSAYCKKEDKEPVLGRPDGL